MIISREDEANFLDFQSVDETNTDKRERHCACSLLKGVTFTNVS